MAKMIDSKLKYKWYIFDLYKKIMPIVLKDYDDISRSQMIKDIIEYYNNEPYVLSYILNDEELDIAFNNIGKELDNVSFRDTLIYSQDSKTLKFSLSEEIKDAFIEEYKDYQENKEKIELEKEIDYFTVGLFRRYGALTKKEYSDIIKSIYKIKDNISSLFSPYVKRFVQERFDETYGLIELDEDYDDILETHPKKIELDYEIDYLINYGKCPIIKNKRYDLIKDKIDNYIFRDMYIYAGCVNHHGFAESYSYSLNELDEELYPVINNYFNEYPKFYLKDLRKDSIDNKGVKLYYKIYPKFMEYCGRKYNIKVDKTIDDAYIPAQIFDVSKKCLENHFDLVDKYIYRDNLNEEEKEFLLGLKKAVGGVGIIMKHTKNGSIIYLDGKLYCVKGIIDAIKEIPGLNNTPCLIDTVFIPYKNSIIHCGVITSHRISIGPNMVKQFNEEIKNKEIINEL